MNRYIDAEWLLNFFEPYPNDYQTPLGSLRACVYDAPSIDIEPKRGEWIDQGWHGDWQFETDGRGNCWYEYKCSECGYIKIGGKSNYCPNCGADMRERREP